MKSPKALSGRIKASDQARRSACLVLEVLSGIRGPSDAAAEMSVSLARYYHVEARALEGLVQALEPRQRGKRGASSEGELAALRKERDRLSTELSRMRTLVRLSHKAAGISSQAGKGADGKRKRRSGRAGRVLAMLKPAEQPQELQPAIQEGG